MDEKRETIAQKPPKPVEPPLPSRVEKPLPGKAVLSEGTPLSEKASESHSIGMPQGSVKIERTSSWFSHMWNWFISA